MKCPGQVTSGCEEPTLAGLNNRLKTDVPPGKQLARRRASDNGDPRSGHFIHYVV
jgi:hypothetical protein